MRSRSLFLVMLAPALALSGCRQDMAEQPKLVANGPAQAFPDGAANRPLIAGTVARGDSPGHGSRRRRCLRRCCSAAKSVT